MSADVSQRGSFPIPLLLLPRQYIVPYVPPNVPSGPGPTAGNTHGDSTSSLTTLFRTSPCGEMPENLLYSCTSKRHRPRCLRPTSSRAKKKTHKKVDDWPPASWSENCPRCHGRAKSELPSTYSYTARYGTEQYVCRYSVLFPGSLLPPGAPPPLAAAHQPLWLAAYLG